MLTAELDDHLASEHEEGSANRRNGSSRKTMLTGTSKVTLDIPRDRAGTFDPKLIAKIDAERKFLQPLPDVRTTDYEDILVTVGKRGVDRVREALQAIDGGDQDIGDAPGS